MAMTLPPGSEMMLAQLALTNPGALATMAAARGMQPPTQTGISPQAMAMPPGLSSPIGSGAAPVPQMPAAGGISDAQRAALMAASLGQGAGALAAPTAAAGGGGGGSAPGPFIPGALASQMPDILKLLQGAGPATPPPLGALIMGR